jgi:hypothetical protein
MAVLNFEAKPRLSAHSAVPPLSSVLDERMKG